MDQYVKYGGARLSVIKAAVKHPEEGIGHPDKPAIGSRADNHLTDQTWTDVAKAVEMAETTFYVMVDYRFRMGSIDATEAATLRLKWPRLRASVTAFAIARTKTEKDAWRRRYAQTLAFTKADLDDMSISK